MGKKKATGKWTPSSGDRMKSEVRHQIRRLTMKVNRWKRYQGEVEANKKSGPVTRWDTSGLEKQIKFLEKLQCTGIKSRKYTRRGA